MLLFYIKIFNKTNLQIVFGIVFVLFNNFYHVNPVNTVKKG